jgi:nitroreductase
MDFKELIKQRQSVRKYSGRPIEREKLDLLIESVRLAPSASNSQPWKLIIVDEPSLRVAVAQATISTGIPMNRWAPEAPVIAVLTVEKPKAVTQVGGWIKQREYPLYDIGIAAEHLCLQATDLGLGTCMIGWFNEREIKKLLGIPPGVRVGLLVTVGYAAEGYPLRLKVRKEVSEMSAWNTYLPPAGKRGG